MPGMMLRALLLLAASAAAVPARAQAPASGQYENLTLAVAGGTVSGVFSSGRMGNGTEAAPQFSCIFLLRGPLQGTRAHVATWFPSDKPDQVIEGDLVFEHGAATLTLAENPGGCMMTGEYFVREPGTELQPRPMTLTRPEPGWTGVAMVTARRAPLRSRPDAPPPRTPYVVRYDAVGVLERRGAWVRASVPGAKAPLSGWLRAAELAPDAPPKQAR